MSTETSTRPYQVGDRVRITDNLRHDLHPEAQYVYEGVVERIDPAADPDSEHKYGPYLWADTEPYTSPSSGEVFDRVFCPLTDDLTTGSDVKEFGRSIELLEPAPTPSPVGDTTPEPFSVFELADAARRIAEAEEPSGDAPQDHGPLAAPLSDRTLDKVLSRPTRVFGFNVVTISPQGIPGGPRLDGVVSRQRAQDELDELEPFMVDGWKTVMVELREVTS